MRADPSTLDGRPFDAVVVGGGNGGLDVASIAFALAQGPLDSVLVVCEHDFGGGVDIRTTGLAAGGVGSWSRVERRSRVVVALAERERLLRFAPHLVRPVPVLWPRVGDAAPRAVEPRALDRYARAARGSTLPRPEHLGRDACLRLVPALTVDGLHGGSVVFEARVDERRLALAMFAAAAAAGDVVTLCSHTEFVERRGDALVLRDRIDGREYRVETKTVVNVGGVAVDAVRERLGVDGPAWVARRTEAGFGALPVPPPGEPRREVVVGGLDGGLAERFIVPHVDGTVVGPVDGVDVAAAAAGALASMTAPDRSAADFAQVWRREFAQTPDAGGAGPHVRSEVVSSARVVSVVGVDAVTDAGIAAAAVAHALGGSGGAESVRVLPEADGPQEHGDPLWWRHGRGAAAVRSFAAKRPELLEPVAAGVDVALVEVVHELRARGAVRFLDVLTRVAGNGGMLAALVDDASALRRVFEVYSEHRDPAHGGAAESELEEVRAVVDARRPPADGSSR